jgi:hypothetical protein
MKKETSHVCIDLIYEGDKFIFWDILKETKARLEKDGVKFNYDNVVTVTEEG